MMMGLTRKTHLHNIINGRNIDKALSQIASRGENLKERDGGKAPGSFLKTFAGEWMGGGGSEQNL